MSKELVISDGLKEMDTKLCNALELTESVFMPVFKRGNQILAIKEAMEHPEAMKYIQALKNNSGGFMTDERPGDKGYSTKELASAVGDRRLIGQLVGDLSGGGSAVPPQHAQDAHLDGPDAQRLGCHWRVLLTGTNRGVFTLVNLPGKILVVKGKMHKNQFAPGPPFA